MNIILLESHANQEKNFIINDLATIKHIKNVISANIGVSLKVGIKNANLGTATIADLSPTRLVLTDINCQTPPPKKQPLSVVLALPRPKVLRRLVLDMTAMGVKQLILVNSCRTEKSYWQSPLLNKIDDYIKEGLQQACDTIPMQVSCYPRLKPFVEDNFQELFLHHQALIAHPYANVNFYDVVNYNQETVLVIGAEGGFIDYEVDLFTRHGCTPVQIGKRILRTENAVSVLCGGFLLNQCV
ncbi:16S ribosomal RNA methyltransferase RsmE [Moraxella macacae 0408225]|uniref:Ribosomal RNA small subunit methyltransferase E n=1 Tax=Moraxella macacae 0408225 TaxID=1230338 RepID=L2F7N8_9GAMM|nr:16S rRNA (uracil(1498)-N(3))-methyltransferase [Moraxella macacae]ELA08925.1 16S ribosomal RNA methyltransferase RsmE [Moraxella macacae 0408225]